MRQVFASILLVALATFTSLLARAVPQLEITMEDWKDGDGKSCGASSVGCQPLKVKCKLPQEFSIASAATSVSSKEESTATPAIVNANPSLSASAVNNAAPAAIAGPIVPPAVPVSSAATASSLTATGHSGTTNSTLSETTNSTALGSTNGSSSSSIAPSFDEFKKAVESCGATPPAENIYKSFIAGIPNSDISSKRELAAFLAQILIESDGLKAREEYACKDNACPGRYDSGPGGQYYGRGYIQLTWKANYLSASKGLYGDERLVEKPQSVAEDEEIAWATAFFFWKSRVHAAAGVQEGNFGATTKVINGIIECGAPNDRAKKRFEYYTKILTAWGITEAPIEAGCYN